MANDVGISAESALGSFIFGLIGNFLPPLSEVTKNAIAEMMDDGIFKAADELKR